jgi:hypothetical protein
MAAEKLEIFFASLQSQGASLVATVRAAEEDAARRALAQGAASSASTIEGLLSEVADLHATISKQTADHQALVSSDAALRAEMQRVAARNTLLEGKLARLVKDLVDEGDGPLTHNPSHSFFAPHLAPPVPAAAPTISGVGTGVGAGAGAGTPHMHTSPAGVVQAMVVPRSASLPSGADTSGSKRARDASLQSGFAAAAGTNVPLSASKLSPIPTHGSAFPPDADEVGAHPAIPLSLSKKGRLEGSQVRSSQPPALADGDLPPAFAGVIQQPSPALAAEDDFHAGAGAGAGALAPSSLPPLGNEASQGMQPLPAIAAPAESEAEPRRGLRLVKWTEAPHVGFRRDAVFPPDSFSLPLVPGLNEIGRTTLNLSDTKISRKQIELDVSSSTLTCSLVVKGLNPTHIIRDGTEPLEKVEKDRAPVVLTAGDSIVFSTTPDSSGGTLPKPGTWFILLNN